MFPFRSSCYITLSITILNRGSTRLYYQKQLTLLYVTGLINMKREAVYVSYATVKSDSQ